MRTPHAGPGRSARALLELALVAGLSWGAGALARAAWLHCDRRVWAERPEPPAYGRFVRCGDGFEFCGGGLGCDWRPHRLSGVDWWGRRYLLRGQVSYSAGPNGIDEQCTGDDVVMVCGELLAVRLYRRAWLLPWLTLDLGLLLLLVVRRRALDRWWWRFVLPLACAIGVAALAEPVLRFVAELAPGALPPYPHALLVLSAGISGGVWGLAFRPRTDFPLDESGRQA